MVTYRSGKKRLKVRNIRIPKGFKFHSIQPHKNRNKFTAVFYKK